MEKRLFTMNLSAQLYERFSDFCDKFPCHKSDLITDLLLNYMHLHETKSCPYPLKKKKDNTEKVLLSVRIEQETIDVIDEISKQKGMKKSELIRDVLMDYTHIFTQRNNASQAEPCPKCDYTGHDFTHCINCFSKK